MASFVEFLRTFDEDAVKRGKQFEHFVRSFLPNEPYWATQIEKIWLWDDYPQQWGRDCGIDLIFETKDKKTWAVQAKCYSPEYEVSKADVDKFLSESNRQSIFGRLLICTTDRIGKNARQVCDGQEKQVVRYLLSHFETADVTYPASIQSLIPVKKKPPARPRPHQIEAIENVCRGFESADRGQMVMACGTGKTLVSLWIKEKLASTRTLVLLPSLNLVSQTLREWNSAATDEFQPLCVCSDQSVSKQTDNSIQSVSDFAFPVSNSVAEIAQFLNSDNNQVIFSTYQSSPLISRAQDDANTEFDLIIADEAHRCAGKTEAAFATVLNEKSIRGKRRLFATATPRIYQTALKKAAGEMGVDVVDMSDSAIFGQRFHTLSFGEAIGRELLTDYRVVVIAVDGAETNSWIENRRLVATDTGLATDAQSLAAQIGLLKAIKKWDLHRVITFHSRVKSARDFAESILEISNWVDFKNKLPGSLSADYVSGEMPTNSRIRKLRHLKEIKSPEIGILSNARCLSEGIDVPALDCVAFIDPRGSEIDIVQAVGRAIRRSENKTVGTIVIPVFVAHSDDPALSLESGDFRSIWRVLEALKSHDDVLSNELDQLRVDLGVKSGGHVRSGKLEKIIIDLPSSIDSSFSDLVRTQIVEQTTESWNFWYGLLIAFRNEHGHIAVPKEYKTADGRLLGFWVQGQRSKKRSLSEERVRRLDLLGFDWDPFGKLWNDGLEHLKEFHREFGHLDVPWKHTSPDGYPLRNWVQRQREIKDTLSADRIERLDAVGFQWVVRDRWEANCLRLEEFFEQNGHCNVPADYAAHETMLRRWCNDQRSRRSELSSEQISRLSALGFQWQLADDWNQGFENLERFIGEHGHCSVAAKYKSADGFRLGAWVQRIRERKSALTSEKLEKLNSLQFDWGRRETRPKQTWDNVFARLVEFKSSNNHSRVPTIFKSSDGYALGLWVKQQRQEKDQLLADQIAKLDNLGFEWSPRREQWQEGFDYLVAFGKENGHFRVPPKYKTKDGFGLGTWFGGQRFNKAKLSQERIDLFNELGVDWDTSPYQAKWNEGISHLQDYLESHGDCRVPFHYKSPDGYALGFWVQTNRNRQEKLSPDRIQQLTAMGFVWSVR